MNEDSKMNVGGMPNYSATAPAVPTTRSTGGSGAAVPVYHGSGGSGGSGDGHVASDAAGTGGGGGAESTGHDGGGAGAGAGGLSSVITQTDASGKPMTNVYGDASKAPDTGDDEHSVSSPRGWRRFFCCGSRATSPSREDKSNATYLPNEVDSIEIDYDEVQVLRSARPEPLMGPIPPPMQGRACLVLDLDETLVHSSFQAVPDADFIIPVEIDGVVHRVYVRKRPGCDEFLKRAGKLYEIVVFTASLAKYANPLLDKLDIHGVVSARLFREACVYYQGKYVKDLALMGRDLRRTIIVDNSPCSYLFHPENAIGCESFIDDPADRTLHVMSSFLESIHDVPDVRKWLHGWQGVTYLA